MKIWLLTSETGLVRGGGIGRYIENSARLLARAGHEVEVFCGAAFDRVEEPEARLRIHYFRESWRTSAPRRGDQPHSTHPAFPYNTVHYWVAYSWQMAREVEKRVALEGAPDIIECQEYNAVGYYVQEDRLQKAEYLKSTCFIVTLHSPDFLLQAVNGHNAHALPAYWRGWMERQSIVRADALLCPSEWLAQAVRVAMGVLPPLEVIPCPLDPGRSGGRFLSATRKAARKRLLYVGRLETRKGVLKLVTACKDMWNKGHDFELWLVGADQPLAEPGETMWTRLKSLVAAEVRRGRLRWLGARAHETLPSIRARCDAQIVPSLWENFPYSAMEALQDGCPVLASNAGGQALMVGDDAGGWVFSWDEDGGFTRAMEAFLASTPGQLRARGKAGRARIEALCAPEAITIRRIQAFERFRREMSPRAQYRFHMPEGAPPERLFGASPDEAPGVTVVIPHRNAGEWVEGAVQSALANGALCAAILVVDDGSTDPASLAKLDSLEQRHAPLLQVLRGPNAGLPAARNRGAFAARTTFLAFIDADDRMEGPFLERATHILERHANVALVYSWVQYTGASRKVFPAWDMGMPYLLAHNQLIPVCVLRRQAYLQCGGMDETMRDGLEDWEMWIRLYAAGGRGVAIAECLARYTVRPDSMYQGIGDPLWLRIAEGIRARHAALVEAFGRDLILLMEANGSPLQWHHPAEWTPWHLPNKRARWAWRKIAILYRVAVAWMVRMGKVFNSKVRP